VEQAIKAQVELIARDAANKAVDYHASNCGFTRENISNRLRISEISFAKLIGLMIGSGIFSGATISALSHLIR
jgi:hypothetical protein